MFQGDTTGRDIYVTQQDVGLDKPLTLGNSRKLFSESQLSTFPEEDEPEEPIDPETPEDPAEPSE